MLSWFGRSGTLPQPPTVGSALRPMCALCIPVFVPRLALHAVLLPPPAADVCLPPATPLESTLMEVIILNTLNPFRMNAGLARPQFAQFWCNVSPCRINTCKGDNILG